MKTYCPDDLLLEFGITVSDLARVYKDRTGCDPSDEDIAKCINVLNNNVSVPKGSFIKVSYVWLDKAVRKYYDSKKRDDN